jgi:hypothetical protein
VRAQGRQCPWRAGRRPRSAAAAQGAARAGSARRARLRQRRGSQPRACALRRDQRCWQVASSY